MREDGEESDESHCVTQGDVGGKQPLISQSGVRKGKTGKMEIEKEDGVLKRELEKMNAKNNQRPPPTEAAVRCKVVRGGEYYYYYYYHFYYYAMMTK